MENVIPMSWLNKVLLIFSVVSASLCLIIQEWTGLTPLPTYISISWATFVTFVSIWFSCFLLRLTLKTSLPVNIKFLNKWFYKRLEKYIKLYSDKKEKDSIIKCRKEPKNEENAKISYIKNSQEDNVSGTQKVKLSQKQLTNINTIIKEISINCLKVWYTNISTDNTFPDEAQELLRKLLTNLFYRATLVDRIKLVSKLADVWLIHLKEYRRALRRVEKGTAANIEEAYKCLHPGSRSPPALEHMLHRLVTVLAQEFLQWELISSLPCKILLSILAKKLLLTIQTISCPIWLFENLFAFLQTVPNENIKLQTEENGIVSTVLSDGMTSVTAAVIPRSLSKSLSQPKPRVVSTNEKENTPLTNILERPNFSLEGLTTEHRGLWGDVGISEIDSEIDDDKISPIYEETTDFATTIARLRNLLQQKSTVTTPMHLEEKSYVLYEGNQFTNLSIPWTEFHTAADGSQQLLYCIQFDDVEQRGDDLFETTTATVRRQYSDFVQLHACLEEISSLTVIMSELMLPEGGRIEMESYLRTLCTRLSTKCPSQLRHFLRPNSNSGKKADVVAPRFDRFLAKTVTGVFNTLKTVVPGFEIPEQEEDIAPLSTLIPLADIPWRFVEDIKSRSLAYELRQLVAERIDYCSVDTAYEAVDTVEGNGDSELTAHWWEIVNTSYDEVDELDSNLTLTCVVIDLICELLAGINSNNAFQQEAVIRWTKLLFGNITECIIEKIILWISDCSNVSFIDNMQNTRKTESIVLIKDKILQILQEKIPYDMKLIFGEGDVQQILKYLLSSYEIKKINLDLSMQILDVLTSQLLISCKKCHDISSS